MVVPFAPPSPRGRGAGGEGRRGVFARPTGVVARARRLRAAMTPAERRLWQVIRRDSLGVRFRRQHAVGGLVLDFYAPSVRLAVELDGGHHADEAAADAARTAWLGRQGISVLRFWNSEVLQNLEAVVAAVRDVAAALAAKTSPPAPLRDGGGSASGGGAFDHLRFTIAEGSARC
ncbi:MAG: endonuclease domain-containing protein [Pseudomonadota bacterium]